VWRLINLPIDYNPPRRTRWLALAQAALHSAAGLPVVPETVLEPMPPRGSVEDYEQAAAAARDAQTLLRSFPGVAGLEAEDAAGVEDACATRITELLPGAITLSASGKCEECGTGIAPWFTTCRGCATRPAVRAPGRTAHRESPRGTQHQDGHPRQSRSAGTAGRAAPDAARGTGRAPGARRGRPARPR
jgi:ATP-dependent RNA helicase SUPV3L1/SUV3